MSFKQLKEAIASGKIEFEMVARMVVPEDPKYSVRGMQAGEMAELDLGLRMAFLQAALAGNQYDNWAVITDDSYWEKEVNYQLLADSGVDAFLLRAYGPSSWVDGQFNPVPDKYYFVKFKKARATGKPVGGYVIHNEWEMVDNPDSSTFAQIQIKQWKEVFYGEFIPDFLCLDWEIFYCYRGGVQITMPGTNQANTVRWTLDAMVKEWGKEVWLYTRVSYINEYGGGTYFRTILDNLNTGVTRAHLHLAYYLNAVLKLTVQTPAEIKAVLPAYTGAMRTYLEFGNTPVNTRIWQLGPVKHAACPDGAVDWNIIPLTPVEFNTLIKFKGTVPPPPPPPVMDETDLEKAVAALQIAVEYHSGQLDELEVWKEKMQEANK